MRLAERYCVITFLFALCVSCKNDGLSKESTNSASSNTSLQVQSAFCPSNDSNPCYDLVLAQLQASNSSINIAMYRLNNDILVDEIIATRDRGVIVRLILDSYQVTKSAYKDSYDQLVAEGIDIRLYTSGQVMHNKFAIFDNQSILSGSYNWTTIAGFSGQSTENVFLTEEEEILEEYQSRFEELWNLGVAP